MALFQDVVQVLHGPKPASPPQCALCFQLLHDRQVGGVLVHIDYPWRGVVGGLLDIPRVVLHDPDLQGVIG